MPQLPAETLFDVTGARCLVLGAGPVATAAAGVLAASGGRVALVDDDETRLAEAARAVAGRGATAETVRSQLRDAGAARALVDELVARWGALEIAVLARLAPPGPGYLDVDGRLWDDPSKRFRDALDDILEETFYVLQAVAAPMRAAGRGRILVLTATAARRSDPHAGYGDVAAGAALVNAARQAAHELGPDGVLVNVLVVGALAGAPPPGHLDDVPLGRAGVPEDVEGAVLFLAGPGSSYVTGAVISVDGGALTRQNPLPPPPLRG